MKSKLLGFLGLTLLVIASAAMPASPGQSQGFSISASPATAVGRPGGTAKYSAVIDSQGYTGRVALTCQFELSGCGLFGLALLGRDQSGSDGFRYGDRSLRKLCPEKLGLANHHRVAGERQQGCERHGGSSDPVGNFTRLDSCRGSAGPVVWSPWETGTGSANLQVRRAAGLEK